MEVLVLTAQPSAEDAVESLRAGAYAFLAKPQPIDALVARVLEAVESGRDGRQAEHDATVRRILEQKPD